MKFKALRTKREPHEFVEICFHRSDADPNEGVWVVYTGELPNPQPETVDMELMKTYYSQQRVQLPEEINLDDFELIEIEAFEANTVGADIRNKLTPSKNLVSMLVLFFTEPFEPRNDLQRMKQNDLIRIIKKEMEAVKISVEYLANLL
jgi:hypothetical protein